MKQYDFDSIVDRHNTDSMKWTVGDGELPMWVADMDFMVAPEIREALQKKLDHGIFGYSVPSEAWREAYINWWDRKHHFKMEREWLHFVEGIVPAVASAIRKFSAPAENVLLMTPVYNHFFYSIEQTGRKILESPLHYERGVYSIDWLQLEQDLAHPKTTLLVLCNPQNPTGNIWSPEDLAHIGELAVRHGVLVLSDEIHCDVTDPDKTYIPFASVNEQCKNNCVMFVSPTKSFNVAGIKTAAVCVPNPALRGRMWASLKSDEIAGVNYFALQTAITAFNECENWLDEALKYIYANKQTLSEYLKMNIPELKLVHSEATYLQWIDCSNLPGDPSTFSAFLREKTGLFVSAGGAYGKVGLNFIRINIACPRRLLSDGLERLKKGVKLYIESVNESRL